MYAQSAFKCMKFLRNRRDLCGKLMPGQRGGRGISNVLRLKKTGPKTVLSRLCLRP